MNVVATLLLTKAKAVHTAEAVDVDSLLRYVVFGALIGLLGAVAFKLGPYDLVIGRRTFYDMGPSLVNGKQPDVLLFCYVVLVIFASLSTIGLLWWRRHFLTAVSPVWFPKVNFSTFAIILAFVASMQLVIASLADQGWTQFMTTAIGWILAVFAFLTFDFYRGANVSSYARMIAPPARVVIMAAFLAICVAHAGKISALGVIFIQTGMPRQAWALFALFAGLAFTAGWYCSSAKKRTTRVSGALLCVAIYVICIREASILWGVDTFHEGETFLTGVFLVSGVYEYLAEFIPIHGLGRNVIPSYISGIFTSDNLYFSRLVRALFFPLVDVLIAGFLLKYSRDVSVVVGFVVLNYLFGFLFDWDISPFMLVALLLISMSSGSAAVTSLSWATGFVLFLESVYSYEFFLFVHIAMVTTLAIVMYQSRWGRPALELRRLYLAFYGATAVFFLLLWDRAFIWFEVLRNALGKSPNLLQRELEIPIEFSGEFFFLVTFVSLFIIFHLFNVVGFLPYIGRTKLTVKRVVLVTFSIVSLMYMVRAFNRSDMGHVLMALYISAPVMLGLILHYRLLRRDTLICGVGMVIVAKMSLLLWHGQLSLDVFKQGALLDARMGTSAIPPLAQIGELKVPAGTVTDDLVTPRELNQLVALKNAGFKLFDMSNQPLLVYGIVGSPLVDRDMHTIFYNTFTEQSAVIERLEKMRDALVIWSSGHWSETLDGTYSELRLPILASYILKSFSHSYQIGRVIVLSRLPLEGLREELVESNSPFFRRHYELGFAPGRMSHYESENAVLLGRSDAMDRVKIGDNKPDAIRIEVSTPVEAKIILTAFNEDRELASALFKVRPGMSHYFIRLNSMPALARDSATNLRYKVEGNEVYVVKTELLKLDPEFAPN